ncbi:thiamine pyrophosphate-requiring protein [Roseomonas sp. NAR14]|uniref:Thiamine pyrophosphate-requiring protein n=1 Tax=Roseomonas acroporae TaxID=2937791 RepID=A0A9X1Y3Z1_9PROT|nr:thiamine pyrophosphate-requiring protein [Roseomonas acroporae]MCK8783003.1 thiamine pyrophosphate-requiring protein [Roseomonas acroporae]
MAVERIEGGAETVAEAWLLLLKARGVDYLFGNAGTDFPSVIEALARGRATGAAMPRPILAPHENAAVCMAHGYAMVTGRAQAAMVHVNVGTANALAGLMNASREQVPLLLAAGRTPILEEGAPGARSLSIHWAQEMFDQAGIVREMVRWDYELREPRQLATVVDRALAIAHSTPPGPVYLSLPREVLARPPEGFAGAVPARIAPASPPAPDPAAIARAAALLAAARCPVVITSRLGCDTGAVAALAEFAERHAVPVVDHKPRYMNLPDDHPLHGGVEPGPWLDEADCLLVLDSDVPWLPGGERPREGTPVIQVGLDPLHARYPIRGFPSDPTILAAPGAALRALDAALAADPAALAAAGARRAAMLARCAALRAAAEERVAAARDAGARMGRAWVSRCIAEAAGDEAVLVNEYPLSREGARRVLPGSYFGASSVSGLGWGLPAALGAQLALPGRTVVATLGDGAYLFANPLACHQIAAAYGLPVLTVVFNNGAWGAVEGATRAMYPQGHAVRDNAMPLVALEPAPDYEAVVRACGGHGERVETAEALPAALRRALRVVREEGRQALLNVLCT